MMESTPPVKCGNRDDLVTQRSRLKSRRRHVQTVTRDAASVSLRPRGQRSRVRPRAFQKGWLKIAQFWKEGRKERDYKVKPKCGEELEGPRERRISDPGESPGAWAPSHPSARCRQANVHALACGTAAGPPDARGCLSPPLEQPAAVLPSEGWKLCYASRRPPVLSFGCKPKNRIWGNFSKKKTVIKLGSSHQQGWDGC